MVEGNASILSQFFAMGGYATYVWSSYGLAALVLAGLGVQSVVSLKRTRRQADALDAARASRQSGPKGTPPT